MSNRVTGCKTSKEISDTLEVKFQGTNAIKKNSRTILTQEYEHFDSKADESLTEIYDRFQNLMNDLSLIDNEYDPEDSNLKFLLAVPEKWDLKVTYIRDKYDLNDTSLDEIYGMLKTHKLEKEKRSKRMLGVVAHREKSGKYDKSKKKCYNCDRVGNFAADYRKPRAEKKQALITKKKNRDDTSESDDEVNHALMVNANIEAGTSELKMNLSHNLQVASFPFRVPDLNSGKVISESLSTSCRSAPTSDPLSADASRRFKPGEPLHLFEKMYGV
ncbi:hypothetical protein AgCh_000678 [Apium graveolens]